MWAMFCIQMLLLFYFFFCVFLFQSSSLGVYTGEPVNVNLTTASVNVEIDCASDSDGMQHLVADSSIQMAEVCIYNYG